MIIQRFEDINTPLALSAFDVRREVFVNEQKVEEREEFDEFEQSSVHFVAIVNGNVTGTARYRETKDGIKLERFAVLKEHRGSGIGDALIKHVLKEVQGRGKRIYLHAQVHVLGFYEKNGFVKTGNEFDECNIRHYKMNYRPLMTSGISIAEAIDHVRNFHDAFGIGNEGAPKAQIDEKDYMLRFRLMKEENEEYLEAAKRGDLVEIADALGDMLYILCGTILKHGLQEEFSFIFEEIQRSNMSKLDANGQPIYREDGKVLKSDLYFRPDIAGILKKYL